MTTSPYIDDLQRQCGVYDGPEDGDYQGDPGDEQPEEDERQ